MISKPALIAAVIGAIIAAAIAVPWALLASRPTTVAVATTPSASPTRSTAPSPAPSPRRRHHRRHLASPAATPAAAVMMIDCQASAVVTPSSYVLACADGGISLQGLTWSSWDAATANASGQISINDCTPNCADGTFRSYPATASVTGLVPYGGGYRYTSLTVSSPGTAEFASDTWPLGLNGP